MRISVWTFVVLVAMVGVIAAGCQTRRGGGGQVLIGTDFNLDDESGTFEVTADEPEQNRGSGTFNVEGFTVTSGTLELKPEAISFTPAGPGKGTLNLQETTTLVITAWIGPLADLETVCDTGEEYGPYDVTLDEDMVPVSVDPAFITLTETTLDLINEGEFAFCLQVVSPADGTVQIGSLTFNLK